MGCAAGREGFRVSVHSLKMKLRTCREGINPRTRKWILAMCAYLHYFPHPSTSPNSREALQSTVVESFRYSQSAPVRASAHCTALQ